MHTSQSVLPRWRGFNLLEMYTTKADCTFREDDFRWIADWGFDFVRLPTSYQLWTEPDDIYKVREPMLEKLDRGIDLGRRHGIHVCLNFHRGPGYCVNPPPEPLSLWHDQEAVLAFCHHWELMAKRYAGIPSSQLSFNLINEPPGPSDTGMTRANHERAMRAAIAAIRTVDPSRLIIIDGVSWGTQPCPELADTGCAQSCRAYQPGGISHYKASWIQGADMWPVPAWPGALNWNQGEPWDRRHLEQLYAPWAELARQGIGVHCGEGGAFCHTPHDVVLRWLCDVLEILTAHNIGYALWNFRGTFGILDSNRADVAYEDWHGHKLDRKLLELLLEF
ncbi:MAG TPA: cellulase family glycosylhydrolase [Planctomycetota bacterium]|nr:cellulase family glycosylhydrolase [Planctomycetota bacterium]